MKDNWPTVTGLRHLALRQDPWMYSDLWFWRVSWQQMSLPAGMFGWKDMTNPWCESNLGMHCKICSVAYQLIIYTSYRLACNLLILTIDLIYLEATSHSNHLEKRALGPFGTRNEWRNSWYIGACDERHPLPMDMDGYGTLPEPARVGLFSLKEKACLPTIHFSEAILALGCVPHKI